MTNDNNKEIQKEYIRAYISQLVFNNGEKLQVNEDDIVLFVGPNNVGKSQSLRDINNLCAGTSQRVVISNVSIIKGEGSLLPLIEKANIYKYEGENLVVKSGHYIDKKSIDSSFRLQPSYGHFKELFVSYLSTAERLSICQPVQIVNRDQVLTSPIHYAAYKPDCAKWLSENFNKAFGKELTANSQHGMSIPLCIGPQVKLSTEYRSAIDSINEYAEALESYPQVDKQGDGIKSFTGILLHLMLDYHRTFIIDEPESFLHPPQARIMGQIIGTTLKQNQQAFISTHSEEIVKGLLDVCEDRLKIVRIMRDGDTNSFSILKNSSIREVFGDPLLRYSNILTSLFHKTVVLCESDSDCKLYSLIDNHLKQKAGKFSETLFIHCGGKQRMAKVAGALHALNIDVRLIADIDVLNDENIIKPIAEEFGVDWNVVKTDINTLSSNLHSPKERIKRINAKNDIDRVIEKSNGDYLSNDDIKQIQEIVRTYSKWDGVKQGGKQAIPAGDATKAFNRLDNEFKSHHIHIVPVGELECFVKEVGGHGPNWVNKVLELHPDFNDEVYQDIKDFIGEIDL